MEAWQKRRLNHIFGADQRTVIVAMDGAPVSGPVAGMAHPQDVLLEIAASGVDAVLLTYGLAQRFGHLLGHLGLILRCDGAVSTVAHPDRFRRIYGAFDALRLDADGIACNIFPRSPNESTSLEYLAHLIAEAAPWHLPVLAEAIPGGFDAGSEHRTVGAIAFAARTAAELGADLVKTLYTDLDGNFREVTEQLYIPVVILGGAPAEPVTLFDMIARALDAGASGVAIGRNIWYHPYPGRMAHAIASIVHDGVTVDQALRLLGEEAAVSRSAVS